MAGRYKKTRTSRLSVWLISMAVTLAILYGVFLLTTPQEVTEVDEGSDFSGQFNQGTTIEVVRDRSIVGALCTVSLEIDGRPLAELGLQEKVSFQLEPDEYVFQSRWTNGMFCWEGGETIPLKVTGEPLRINVRPMNTPELVDRGAE